MKGKKFKKNNQTIALNVLCAKNGDKIYPAYITKTTHRLKNMSFFS